MKTSLKKRGTRTRNRNRRIKKGGTKKKITSQLVKYNNCKKKCKTKFINEIKQDKRYKVISKITSFFDNKLSTEDELNKILDIKDIQDDEVFQDCVNKCM